MRSSPSGSWRRCAPAHHWCCRSADLAPAPRHAADPAGRARRVLRGRIPRHPVEAEPATDMSTPSERGIGDVLQRWRRRLVHGAAAPRTSSRISCTCAASTSPSRTHHRGMAALRNAREVATELGTAARRDPDERVPRLPAGRHQLGRLDVRRWRRSASSCRRRWHASRSRRATTTARSSRGERTHCSTRSGAPRRSRSTTTARGDPRPKVVRIARSDLAMQHLRVCNKEREEWNCGRCEKCLRTDDDAAARGLARALRHAPGPARRPDTRPPADGLRR